jgi:hypothetical protein
VLPPNAAVTVTYDTTVNRWRVFTSRGVTSDTTGIPGATGVTNIVVISQAAYDALATKDPTTLYLIV